MFGEHHTHSHEHREYRAPTDDSVKLLREMEQSAKNEIINAVRVQNMDIDVVIHSRDDILNCQLEFMLIYQLNGKKRTCPYRHSTLFYDNSPKTRDELVSGMLKALSEHIAIHLLDKPFNESLNNLVGITRW